MSDDRDPVVERAFRDLPVPDHQPGFWDAFEARLAAEQQPVGLGVSGAAGRSPSDQGPVPAGDGPVAPVSILDDARFRNGIGRGRTLAIAAVAAGLVVAVGILRSSPDEGERLRTAGRDQATASSTEPAQGPTVRGAAEDAVTAWLEAIGAGDIVAAAELTGPRSRRYLDSLEASLEGYLTEAGEGYGAWAAAPDRTTTGFDLPGDSEDEIRIVVISGTWNGEGGVGYRSDALPVVRSNGGRWLVEPVAIDPVRGGRLELLSPEPGEDGFSGLAPDAVVEAGASGGGTFFFSIDEAPLTKVAGRRVGGGVRGSFDPPGEMTSRTHSLLVAYLDGDTIAAFATTFLVEG